MKSISLVFPIYNEAEIINESISKALDILPTITNEFEIIAVNDSSTDATASLLENWAKKSDKIKVFHNVKNRKLGGALKEGFKRATKELILYSDFDMPFDIRESNRSLAIMKKENADMVTAYRTNRYVDGNLRMTYSFVYNFLINFIFRFNLKDINFSFKLFKRKILDQIELRSEGSFICAELLIKSQLRDFKIVQMPVQYSPRRTGRSMLSTPSVISKILEELILFYFKFYINQRHKRRNCY